jgi:hypothetical protein
MNILRYGEYITEKAAFQMLLESKAVFSTKLINLLNRMKSNKVAKAILSFQSKDVDGLAQNYVDVTDSKEDFTFTPDRKVQQLIAGRPEVYKVINSGRYLTHSDRNNKIFERLGYDKTGRDNWAPETGTILKILAETQSVTGNTYCMVEEVLEEGPGEPRIGVINKAAIELDSDELKAIWKTSRNPVKVGRFARAFLTAAKVEFSDRDIEEFVNQYKATFDFAQNVLAQFDIVKGKDIIHWYWVDQYQSGGGTLNNSCMAEADSDWLAIYAKNKQVSLVVLYDDNGTVNDGKYTSTKIKGRAILWECKVNGQDGMFLDRIYTSHDSDVELFKQYAEKNGWWYKKSQTMSPDEKLTNGSQDVSRPNIVCKVDDADPTRCYPYMDTMCFINTSDNLVGNSVDAVDPEGQYSDSYDEYDGPIRCARTTDGEWYSADNY